MYRRVLVPVDLEDTALLNKAFHVVRIFLAQDPTCSVRLVNVQPIVPISIMDYLPPKFDEDLDNKIQNEFKKLISDADFPEDNVTKYIRRGSVWNEVIAESNDWASDIIIIGSHKPSMSTYLLGSNAAAIVRHAKCSVLVVR